MEFLHGSEETMDGGLVEGEAGRKLSDAHFRAILPQVQQNANSLLQGFAGAGFAAIARGRLSATPRYVRQTGASGKAQGREKNFLLTAGAGESESRHSVPETLFHYMKHQIWEENNHVFARLLVCGRLGPPKLNMRLSLERFVASLSCSADRQKFDSAV